MPYRAPIDDIMTALDAGADLDRALANGDLEGLDRDLVAQVVTEAGRFAEEELAPLNRLGDKVGARLTESGVVMPAEFKAAYRSWCEAGWSGLPCPEAYGGQNLPSSLSMAACEIWNGANTSFALGPILTHGAVHALEAKASPEIRERYLARLTSGEWAGTMNLTEPQAGSDLGALRTRAERAGDGTYRITGTKIFISYGDHDLTENIVHLVLARLPDAPPGTKGISLFLVPKRLVSQDGSLGALNDVRCTGLEHKLGLHSSPTCTMTYGEHGGAVGWLIGEEHKGLAVMFLMMNAARLAVGIQGVAIAEAATQHAIAYANERRQGAAPGAAPGEMSPIVRHPDVQRNLMRMKALTAASRMLCLATAGAIDRSERARDAAARAEGAATAALLTPVAKAFSTDAGVEVASLGIQVHGGMGYIEETGAAQLLRDARIFTIYEGTNGIQAIDLAVRKLPLEGGAVVRGYIGFLRGILAEVRASNEPGLTAIARDLDLAVDSLAEATEWMLSDAARAGDGASMLAVATPYLALFGKAAGGCYLARAALRALRRPPGTSDHASARELARFFATNIAAEAVGDLRVVLGGGDGLADGSALALLES
ncbi:MAG: acyl-CoA dehydrogenase [Rhizobiales bacterium]|nr:acyl-CoA dehydrogenase [Hyphomicrobiales bacterium]